MTRMTRPPDEVPGPGGPVWGTRPRLPWVGVFLVLFGGLLLLDQLVPEARLAGSAFVVALGAALLVSWAVGRERPALYLGLVVVSLSLPGLLQEAGVLASGPGWGSLFLGVGLLLVALGRWVGRGGIGWQLTFGLLFAAFGGIQVAEHQVPGFPSVERAFWPLAIVAIGAWIVLRGVTRTRT